MRSMSGVRPPGQSDVDRVDTTKVTSDGRDAPGRDDLALDDDRDADELRQRYGTLLQELRVQLPGVQVLVAFLLTAPFASRFNDLDLTGRRAYGAAVIAAMLSLIAFASPTAMHRFGERRNRSQRLHWGIRYQQIGIVLLGVALECALFVVIRLVFDERAAVIAVAAIGLAMVGAWFVGPALLGRTPRARTT